MLCPNNWAGLFICESMLTTHNFITVHFKSRKFQRNNPTLSYCDQYCPCTKYYTYARSKKGKSRPLRIDDF